MPISHANPGERRFTFHYSALGVLGERNVFEIKLPRQRRDDANSRLTSQVANLGRKNRGRVLAAAGRGELASLADLTRAAQRKLSRAFLQKLPQCVKQSHRELLLLARSHQNFGGDDLHLSRRLILRNWRFLGRLRTRISGWLSIFQAKAIKLAGRWQIDPAMGHNRRTVDRLAGFHPHLLQRLDSGGGRLEDLKSAGRTDIQFSIGVER